MTTPWYLPPRPLPPSPAGRLQLPQGKWEMGWEAGDGGGTRSRPPTHQSSHTHRATYSRDRASEWVGTADLSVPFPAFRLQSPDGKWGTRMGDSRGAGPAVSSQGRWPCSQARPREHTMHEFHELGL